LKSQLLPLYVSSTLKKAPPLQAEPLQLPMSQLLQVMPLVTIIVLSACKTPAAVSISRLKEKQVFDAY
jgi:hypothetical protein